MKTSVEKLYFDWQDPNTGEFPKSYQIRVHAPGTGYDGDLMSHRLMKLLREHGGEAVNFPEALLKEVYDDCCWALAGYIFSGNALEYMGVESCGAVPHNCAHLTDDEWFDLADSIIDCMHRRIEADALKYLELVANMPVPDNVREKIDVTKANEEYAAEGDWVLSLEDQSLMPEITLVMLGLRRAFWSAYWQNCDQFAFPEEYDDEDRKSVV